MIATTACPRGGQLGGRGASIAVSLCPNPLLPLVVSAVSAAAYRLRRASRLHRGQKTPSQKRLDPPPKQRRRRTATGRRAKQGRASWRPFPLPIRKGQRPSCPSPVRESMALNHCVDNHAHGGAAGHLSGSDRATRCPTERRPAAERTLVGQGRLAVSTNW